MNENSWFLLQYTISSAMYSTWPSLFWNQHNRGGWKGLRLLHGSTLSPALPSCGPALTWMCGVRPKQSQLHLWWKCASSIPLWRPTRTHKYGLMMPSPDNHWLRISWMPGATPDSEVSETDTLPSVQSNRGSRDHRALLQPQCPSSIKSLLSILAEPVEFILMASNVFLYVLVLYLWSRPLASGP